MRSREQRKQRKQNICHFDCSRVNQCQPTLFLKKSTTPQLGCFTHKQRRCQVHEATWELGGTGLIFHHFPDEHMETQSEQMSLIQLDSTTTITTITKLYLAVSSLFVPCGLAWHGMACDLTLLPQKLADHEQTSIGHLSRMINLQVTFRFVAWNWMKQSNFMGTRWTRIWGDFFCFVFFPRFLGFGASASGRANAEAFWAPPSGVAAQPQARHVKKHVQNDVENDGNGHEIVSRSAPCPGKSRLSILKVCRSRALGNLRWQIGQR